jgi:diguanylate cyclase (GGDEF)-like protein
MAKQRDQGAEDLDRDTSRDKAAKNRDRAADKRDRAAEKRDRAAEERDRAAESRDHRESTHGQGPQQEIVDESSPKPHLDFDEERKQAAKGRVEGAADREGSSRDREDAKSDRQEARDDRRVAKKELVATGKDDLTGLLRRGGGLLELEREIARSRRTKGPLTVAFLDVDGLKHLNDVHGHQAGDDALRAVAVTLKKRLRAYDVIARFGGDEFLCGLPGLGAEEANLRLLAVRDELAAAALPVSIAFGVAQLEPDEDLESLVARADAALYQHRRHELNRSEDRSSHQP